MLSNVEFAFLTRMNWAGLEWRMRVHLILSIKNGRGRSPPYQLDNRRWWIGGPCPIVKLSMPSSLVKNTGRSFTTSPRYTKNTNHSPCWFRCFSAGPDQDKVQQGESLQVIFFPGCVFWNPPNILSTDCMWDLLSTVDGHNPFTTWGYKTSIYESLYQHGNSLRRISPTVCLFSKIQNSSLRRLCEQRHGTFHDPCESLLYTNKLNLNKNTKQSKLKIISDWFPHFRFQCSMHVVLLEVG